MHTKQLPTRRVSLLASKPQQKAEPSQDNMKRTNYFIPPKMKSNLEALARRKSVHVSELVRQAIGSMLKRNGFTDE